MLIGILAIVSGSLPSQPSNGVVALRNLRVIDGTGRPAAENQTLVIERGRIRSVEEASRVAIPAGAQELELSGHTVLPGLVMLHEHLNYSAVGEQFTHALPFSAPRLYLAFGVTTIRTAGTDHPYVEINLKRAIDRGEVPGPEIHLTSPYFDGPGGLLTDITVTDPADARRSVQYWAAQGISWFKVYTHISKPVLAVVIEEAHKHGARVTGHLESVSCTEAADLGIDNIEHGVGSCRGELVESGPSDSRAARGEALIRKLVESRVTLTATPVDVKRPLTDRELDVLHPSVRDSYLRAFMRRSEPGGPGALPRGVGQLTLQFVKAGGRVVLGSDAPCCDRLIPGFANHNAIELLVEAGISPLDAIRIATFEGARLLGSDDRVGSIAAGKEADLLIVRGNPAAKIADISNVTHVFANGKRYDPAALVSAVSGQVGWR
jgi:imidazolonepropionase-like amidohydrolase